MKNSAFKILFSLILIIVTSMTQAFASTETKTEETEQEIDVIIQNDANLHTISPLKSDDAEVIVCENSSTDSPLVEENTPEISPYFILGGTPPPGIVNPDDIKDLLITDIDQQDLYAGDIKIFINYEHWDRILYARTLPLYCNTEDGIGIEVPIEVSGLSEIDITKPDSHKVTVTLLDSDDGKYIIPDELKTFTYTVDIVSIFMRVSYFSDENIKVLFENLDKNNDYKLYFQTTEKNMEYSPDAWQETIPLTHSFNYDDSLDYNLMFSTNELDSNIDYYLMLEQSDLISNVLKLPTPSDVNTGDEDFGGDRDGGDSSSSSKPRYTEEELLERELQGELLNEGITNISNNINTLISDGVAGILDGFENLVIQKSKATDVLDTSISKDTGPSPLETSDKAPETIKTEPSYTPVSSPEPIMEDLAVLEESTDIYTVLSGESLYNLIENNNFAMFSKDDITIYLDSSSIDALNISNNDKFYISLKHTDTHSFDFDIAINDESIPNIKNATIFYKLLPDEVSHNGYVTNSLGKTVAFTSLEGDALTFDLSETGEFTVQNISTTIPENSVPQSSGFATESVEPENMLPYVSFALFGGLIVVSYIRKQRGVKS